MLLTGHKTGAIFDRYYIVNEQELLSAGDQQAPAQTRRSHARVAAGATGRLDTSLRLVRTASVAGIMARSGR